MSDVAPINIVISGYPKSGTTWLTKLVAGILDCPASGFWGVEGDILSTEGSQRKSPYRCYKAHQLYDELSSSQDQISKIIYIMRDPRDVIVSGAHHYTFLPHWLRAVLRTVVRSSTLRHRIFYRLSPLISLDTRKNKMLDQVIGQSDYPSQWLRHSWSHHIESYQDRIDVLMVRYEDLLDDPLRVCTNIGEFIQHDISTAQLKTIIQEQSFRTKKGQHLKEGDYFNHRHMRKGIANQWKTELNKEQVNKIQVACQAMMAEYRYR